MNTSTELRTTMRTAGERLGLASLIVGIAASVTLAGAVVTAQANPVDYTDPLYVTCMRNSARTPDVLEQYVDVCTDRAHDAKPRFEECMRGAAGTADALEQWVVPCAKNALAHAESNQGNG